MLEYERGTVFPPILPSFFLRVELSSRPPQRGGDPSRMPEREFAASAASSIVVAVSEG